MATPLAARFALAVLALAGPATAAAPASEAAVKAAFVYNFTKFIEWPAEAFTSAADPIRLCLYGSQDPFLTALATIDGKQAQNRSIRVVKVGRPADFRGCHVLVVAESELRQLPEAVHAAADQGSVSIAEIDGFVDTGGTIGLVVENDRVQFEVNLEAARRANLRMSSQLLKLARKVRR